MEQMLKRSLFRAVWYGKQTFRRACINKTEASDCCSTIAEKMVWDYSCIVILSQMRLEEGQEIR